MKSNRFGINPAKDTPLLERFFKNLRHRVILLNDTWVHKKRPPAFVTYPDLPSRRSAVHKICRALNWELTNVRRSTPHLLMRFEDETEKEITLPNWMSESNCITWNKQCTDIRKSILERAHQECFGYGMGVDAFNFVGSMVVKSERNAQHDGRIIQGPITAKEHRADSVYQIDIQNVDESGRYFDYRLVYIRGSIPLAYRKYKAKSTRFTNMCESACIAEVTQALSNQEIRLIQQMMRLLHVDYAELDALRDAKSGKLFVIDVNPTPWGPPAELSAEQQVIAIQTMANAFAEAATPWSPTSKL
ncbi:MAG: hypothetical protein CL834_05925 [Crocinitomicaceae bacterium]|nr:hypothetical protein [Crocinitomicaceae bacterium]